MNEITSSQSHLFCNTVNIWKSWCWNIILTLIHICQAGKKRVVLQAFEQTWSDILINILISCHSSGAISDEAVCCRLMDTGLILQLNDLSWPGGWFHLQGSFFSQRVWSHTQSQPALFYPSLGRNHHLDSTSNWMSIQCLCRILVLYLFNDNANLATQAFSFSIWFKSVAYRVLLIIID